MAGKIVVKWEIVWKRALILAIFLIQFVMVPGLLAFNSGAIIQEDFRNLDDWKPLRFDKAKKNTVYTPTEEDGATCLKAQSDRSASALLCKTEFDVYKYPIVRWRWKVSNIYEKGDIRKKQGNDSPARLFVMFKYNPKRAGFFTKIKYSVAKKIYGRYPPQSALCYIWANKPHKENIIPSPSFGQIKYIVLEAGGGQVGKWRDEEVNILEDYKKAFGKMPPHTAAAIAFMDDSDNTGGSSTAWLSGLDVLRKPVVSVSGK